MPGPAEIVRVRSGECRQAAELLPMLAAREEGARHPTDGDSTEGRSIRRRWVDGRSAPGRPCEDVPKHLAGHVAQCLRCQAELAAYRRILRHLRALRQDEVRSPPGALVAVLAALEAAALEERAANRALRVVAVGGLTVATAAATTAGVLVWMSRRRLGLADTG